jgi:hypothetical protein
LKKAVQNLVQILKVAIVFCLFTTYSHALVKYRHKALHPQFNIHQQKSLFTQDLDENYKSSLIENCDLQEKKARYELAQYLDKNNETITSLNSKISQDNEAQESIKIGELSVKVVKENNAADGFITEFDSSWNKLLIEFKELKNLDLSSNLSESNVKSLNKVLKDFVYIMANDSDRLNGYNMYLGYDSDKMLLSMKNKVDACKADYNCRDIKFNNEELSLIKLYHMYSTSYESFKATGSEDSLNDLLRSIEQDLSLFDIEANASVFIDEGKILLPLVLNPELLSGKETFSSIVENIWSSSELKLKLVFDQTGEDVFKVVFLNSSGRSRVNYVEKSLKLHQEVRSRSIAHEVGHVLGLYDNYFTQWRPTSCEYYYQYNPGDIMSEVYGKVLPKHWETLKTVYQ